MADPDLELRGTGAVFVASPSGFSSFLSPYYHILIIISLLSYPYYHILIIISLLSYPYHHILIIISLLKRWAGGLNF